MNFFYSIRLSDYYKWIKNMYTHTPNEPLNLVHSTCYTKNCFHGHVHLKSYQNEPQLHTHATVLLTWLLLLLMLCRKRNLVNVIQWFGHLVFLWINVSCFDLIVPYLSAAAASSCFSLSARFVDTRVKIIACLPNDRLHVRTITFLFTCPLVYCFFSGTGPNFVCFLSFRRTVPATINSHCTSFTRTSYAMGSEN